MPLLHVDEEQIQRLLDGELESPAQDSVRDHLVTCSACRSRLAQVEQKDGELLALLRLLDHAPPRVDAEALAGGARGRTFSSWRRAATVALMLGAAGAAYAVPGSPVRGWIDRMASWVVGPPEPVTDSPATVEAEPSISGIAVAPGQRFSILFSTYQTAGRASVSLSDETAVVVRALNGTAAFTSDVGRLLIGNEGSAADFEIQIPREAPWVEIRVAGRQVLLKDGSQIVSDDAMAAPGGYTFPLAPPAP